MSFEALNGPLAQKLMPLFISAALLAPGTVQAQSRAGFTPGTATMNLVLTNRTYGPVPLLPDVKDIRTPATFNIGPHLFKYPVPAHQVESYLLDIIRQPGQKDFSILKNEFAAYADDCVKKVDPLSPDYVQFNRFGQCMTRAHNRPLLEAWSTANSPTQLRAVNQDAENFHHLAACQKKTGIETGAEATTSTKKREDTLVCYHNKTRFGGLLSWAY